MSNDEIKKFIKNIINKILNFIRKRFFDIVTLIISVLALWIAMITLDKSIQQFEQNATSSDSLFKVQLKNSKELNDSLIFQIKELQGITSSQLKITDQQLKISTETYREQLYSNRPKIVIIETKIIDTLYSDTNFCPIITLDLKNIGKRYAFKTKQRNILIYSDFSGFKWANINYEDSSFIVEPESGVSHYTRYFQPIIPAIHKDEFFFLVEIKYTDKELNQEFVQYYYYRYDNMMGKYGFYFCKTKDEIKLRKYVNNLLKKYNYQLFDQ